jgi:hypothetical protein
MPPSSLRVAGIHLVAQVCSVHGLPISSGMAVARVSNTGIFYAYAHSIAPKLKRRIACAVTRALRPARRKR